MIGFLIAVGVIVGVIVGLALVLPCQACQKRRERIQRALDDWRRHRNHAP